MILLQGAHHVIVQGFDIAGAATNAPGAPGLLGPSAGILIDGDFVHTSKLAHHIAIVGNFSHHHRAWGIHSVDSHTVLVQDNLFAASGREHAAYFSDGSDDYVIRRNVFFGSNACGLQVNVDPLASLEKVASHPAIGYPPMQPTRAWALGLLAVATRRFGENAFPDGRGFNFLIEDNVINGNGRIGGAGINLAGVRESLIQNNLIYGNASAGIAEWDNGNAFDAAARSPGPQTAADVTGPDALPIFGCSDNVVRNNTILSAVRGRAALLVGNGSWGTRAYDNVLVNDAVPSVELRNTSIWRFEARHNVLGQVTYEGPAAAMKSLATSLPDGAGSVTGVTRSALAPSFVRPGDEPWVVLEGTWWKTQPLSTRLPSAGGHGPARRARGRRVAACHRSRRPQAFAGRYRRLRVGSVTRADARVEASAQKKQPGAGSSAAPARNPGAPLRALPNNQNFVPEIPGRVPCPALRCRTMSALPFVSIAMPSYNEELYIEECLRSLLDQDYPANRMEILVGDGGSQDRTREIIDRMAKQDGRIRLLDNSKHRIQSYAMNLAIKESKGEFILVTDVHAEYAPNYVSKLVEAFQRTGADCAGGAQRGQGPDLVPEGALRRALQPAGCGRRPYRSPDKEGFVDTVFPGSFRRSILEKVGLLRRQGGHQRGRRASAAHPAGGRQGLPEQGRRRPLLPAQELQAAGQAVLQVRRRPRAHAADARALPGPASAHSVPLRGRRHHHPRRARRCSRSRRSPSAPTRSSPGRGHPRRRQGRPLGHPGGVGHLSDHARVARHRHAPGPREVHAEAEGAAHRDPRAADPNGSSAAYA